MHESANEKREQFGNWFVGETGNFFTPWRGQSNSTTDLNSQTQHFEFSNTSANLGAGKSAFNYVKGRAFRGAADGRDSSAPTPHHSCLQTKTSTWAIRHGHRKRPRWLCLDGASGQENLASEVEAKNMFSKYEIDHPEAGYRDRNIHHQSPSFHWD